MEDEKKLVIVRILVCERMKIGEEYGQWVVEEVEMPTRKIHNAREMVDFYKESTEIAKSRYKDVFFAIALGVDRIENDSKSVEQ